jgi:hypothetical protein
MNIRIGKKSKDDDDDDDEEPSGGFFALFGGKKSGTNICMFIYIYRSFYVFLVMPYWLGLCGLHTHIESRFWNPHVVIFT